MSEQFIILTCGEKISKMSLKVSLGLKRSILGTNLFWSISLKSKESLTTHRSKLICEMTSQMVSLALSTRGEQLSKFSSSMSEDEILILTS